MTAVRTYLLAVVAGALLVQFVSVFFPECSQKKMVSFVGSLLLVLLVVSPFGRIRAFDMAAVLAEMRLDAEELRTGVAVKNREIQEMIIGKSCAAYILDKAKELGADLRVTVYLSDSGSIPYPTGVKITGTCTPEVQQRLVRLMKQDLAIPEEKQIWSEEP